MSAALVEHAGCWMPGGCVVVVVFHLQGEKCRDEMVRGKAWSMGWPCRTQKPTWCYTTGDQGDGAQWARALALMPPLQSCVPAC